MVHNNTMVYQQVYDKSVIFGLLPRIRIEAGLGGMQMLCPGLDVLLET